MTTSPPAGGRRKSYRMAETRKDKKAIQAYVDAAVWRQLKLMAMDSEKTLQELIAEILTEAVAKPHKRKGS